MPRPCTIFCLLALGCSTTLQAQGWQPPSGGAVDMFRQADRTFLVGASGGAGGSESPDSSTRTPLHFTERTLEFELVPVEHWDTPGSPAGHGVEGGRVHFYRPGEYRPAHTAPADEPVALPVGRWYLVGEAPGWTTTHQVTLDVHPGDQGGGGLVMPVLAACEVRFEEDPDWHGVDRLDVVSLTESAVYPMAPGQQDSTRVPAGRFLTYSISGGRITGLGGEGTCAPGDRLALPPPGQPAVGRQALIVETRAGGGRDGSTAGVEVLADSSDADAEPTVTRPDAVVRMSHRSYAVFTDLPAAPLRLRMIGENPSKQGGEPVARSLDAEQRAVRLVRLAN